MLLCIRTKEEDDRNCLFMAHENMWEKRIWLVILDVLGVNKDVSKIGLTVLKLKLNKIEEAFAL